MKTASFGSVCTRAEEYKGGDGHINRQVMEGSVDDLTIHSRHACAPLHVSNVWLWAWPRVCCSFEFAAWGSAIHGPQCKRHLVEDMWARRAPRARAACGPCYRRHSLSPSVSSIIHGMHDEMLSRREWHCTCEWHFWRALAAALAKQSISSPPPRSPPPGAHVSWTCRHTCHFTCACVVYIFTNPKRQVKAPPFKHLQKASVLAERAVLTTQGFCGWDRVWD